MLVALLMATGQLFCDDINDLYNNFVMASELYKNELTKDYALNGCENRDEDKKRDCFAVHAELMKYFAQVRKEAVVASMIKLQDHIARPGDHIMYLEKVFAANPVTKELTEKNMNAGKQYYDHLKHIDLLKQYIYHKFEKRDRVIPAGFSAEAIAKIVREETLEQEKNNPEFIKQFTSCW